MSSADTNAGSQADDVTTFIVDGVVKSASLLMDYAEASAMDDLWKQYEKELGKIIPPAKAKRFVADAKATNPNVIIGAFDSASKQKLAAWQNELEKELKKQGEPTWLDQLVGGFSRGRLVDGRNLANQYASVAARMKPKLVAILKNAKIDLSGWTAENVQRIRDSNFGLKAAPAPGLSQG